jgi:hypothetical protein
VFTQLFLLLIFCHGHFQGVLKTRNVLIVAACTVSPPSNLPDFRPLYGIMIKVYHLYFLLCGIACLSVAFSSSLLLEHAIKSGFRFTWITHLISDKFIDHFAIQRTTKCSRDTYWPASLHLLFACGIKWMHSRMKHFLNAFLKRFRNIPTNLSGYFFTAIVWCLVSIYIGTFNIENNNEFSLSQRYNLLPMGLAQLFLVDPGLLLLLVMNGLNLILLRSTNPGTSQQNIIKQAWFILFFMLIYLLALPLGGYRSYRPFILRYDTFLPITLMLVFLFARSSLYLITCLKERKWKMYMGSLILFF